MDKIFKKAYDLFTTGLADLIREFRKDKIDVLSQIKDVPAQINASQTNIGKQLLAKIDEIKNQDDIKLAIAELAEVLREEVAKLDKEIILENDYSNLEGGIEKLKSELLKSLNEISSKLDNEKSPIDYTDNLVEIAKKLPNFKDFETYLKEFRDKLKGKIKIEIDEKLIEDDRIKVSLNDKQLEAIRGKGGAYPMYTGNVKLENVAKTVINPATKENQDSIISLLTSIAGKTGDIKETPTIANVPMAVAGTQYSYALPLNTKSFVLKARLQSSKLQFCFIDGETNTNFLTIAQNDRFDSSEYNMDLDNKTIYVQSTANNDVAELLIFT